MKGKGIAMNFIRVTEANAGEIWEHLAKRLGEKGFLYTDEDGVQFPDCYCSEFGVGTDSIRLTILPKGVSEFFFIRFRAPTGYPTDFFESEIAFDDAGQQVIVRQRLSLDPDMRQHARDNTGEWIFQYGTASEES